MKGMASAEKSMKYQGVLQPQNHNFGTKEQSDRWPAERSVGKTVSMLPVWLLSERMASREQGQRWTSNGAFHYTSSSRVLKLHSELSSIDIHFHV